MEQLLSDLRTCLEIPVDVFDDNNGGIDDDPEVDCPHGQKVRVFATQDQYDDAEEQCERDICADDNGAAQVAEEYPLDEKNQDAPEHEVVQHGACRDTDQLAAIVVGDQFHAGREGSINIDFLNFRANASNHVIGPVIVKRDFPRHVVLMKGATISSRNSWRSFGL